ncbi:MAG: 3-hydroxyacyl-ACP dehydratase FabZ [Limnochordia bacterium]|nr:MAG: hypothetical protein AA931_00270 [Peptococcaceae bacterium 1109]
MLSIDEIREKLPHRYPFLMVDKVLELEEGKRIVALKNVTINEPFFQGHYPHFPVMPGVMILEAMAQVGGLAVGGSEDESIPLLAAVERARFKEMVRPGDQLVITAQVVANRSGIVKVEAEAKVKDVLCAAGQLTFMLAKRGDVVGRG